MRLWHALIAGGVLAGSACTVVAGLDELEFGAGGAAVSGGTATGGSGGASSSGGAGGAGGSLGSISFTDDELAEFDAGSYGSTEWATDRLQLAAGQPTGTFTSQVFDAGATVNWTGLRWAPDAPYGKALPDGAASEMGYPRGGADMSSNILLLHLDGSGSAAHGELLAESSGLGHTPAVWHDSQGSMPFVPGKFGNAISTTLADHLYVDVQPGSAFDFGTADFTWALWVNTTLLCDSVRTWMGIENAADVHLWLGCKNATASSCCNAPSGTQAGGTFISGSSDSVCYCGARAIDDGQWHHVALVKRGHASAQLFLFVDGTIDSVTPNAFQEPMVFPDATRFTVGAFDFWPPTGPAHQTEALFDDVAVWTRGLSDAEVQGLANRGQLTLSLQVRVCGEPDCSDDPAFVGPGASSATSFVDDGPNAPVQHVLAGLPSGRYLQYRASFATRVSGMSPALRSVTVYADPP